MNEIDEVPDGSTLIFSAHGVSQAILQAAQKRELRIFDATCPLVTKVHLEVMKMHREDCSVIVIGHKGHPEVEGTLGQVDSGIFLVQSVEDAQTIVIADPTKVAYVTQTTLSIDDTAEIIQILKARFPMIQEPKKADICYATTNRQVAVKSLSEIADIVIVVGSPSSSNSNRLQIGRAHV